MSCLASPFLMLSSLLSCFCFYLNWHCLPETPLGPSYWIWAFLKLPLVLPTGSGLPLLSFLKSLLVILSWDVLYSPVLQCCVFNSVSLLNKLSGRITMVYSSLRPLQCQTQFLKCNKSSIINCLIEWGSNKFLFVIMCGQNNNNKFINTVSCRARMWTWAATGTLPLDFVVPVIERIAVDPAIQSRFNH